MKRRTAFAGVLAALVPTLSSCGSTTKPTASPSPIPVGLNLELSGPGAILGKSELRGLTIAVDTINRAGGVNGRKIKLLKRDNKTDPSTAVQITRQLSARHVAAMIGTSTSPTAVPVAGVSEQLRLPTISMATAQEVVNPVSRHRYTFKLSPNNADMSVVQAQELARKNVHKVAFFAPKNAYGDSSTAAFLPAAHKAGLDVVSVQRFDATRTDLTGPSSSAINAGAEGIAAAVIPPQSVVLAKTLKSLHFDGPVVFDSGAGAELFVHGAGRASEGMFMVYDWIMASNYLLATTPTALKQQEFFDEYTRQYGEFSGFAALGADAVQLVAHAVAAAHSTTPEEIRNALEKTTYDGLGGRYVFTRKYHGGMTPDSLMVLTVHNGGWIPAA